jgi:hypothetical protein
MAVAPALSAISAVAEAVEVAQSITSEMINAKNLFELRITRVTSTSLDTRPSNFHS